MLRKLRGNVKGFTLIELMIVIAIIGILAAIAIPNYISYRNKAFCSAAESDANSIASAIADYFAVPNRVNNPVAAAVTAYNTGVAGFTPIQLSGSNTVTVSGTPNAITITVTDNSSRCPTDYQTSQTPDWSVTTPGVFRKDM